MFKMAHVGWLLLCTKAPNKARQRKGKTMVQHWPLFLGDNPKTLTERHMATGSTHCL